MNLKIVAVIEKYQMLSPHDTVIVAVSGGADSVALLDFLSAGGCPVPLDVRACHLNHHLRGQESDRDEQFVRTMCAQYGVPLDVAHADIKAVAAEKGISVELAARESRYAFFEGLAEKYGCKVATAHTQSDLIETVLFNISRGTGLAGLCGIPPVRDSYIRPLIECSRGEIEQYCKLHALAYVTDSSNLADIYTRNYIRHHIVSHFSYVNPQIGASVTRMTEQARQDAAYFDQQVESAWAFLHGEQGLRLDDMRAQHPAIRTRIIVKLLAGAQIERTAQRITLIDDMVTGKNRHEVLQVGKAYYVTVQNGFLNLRRYRQKQPAIAPIAVKKTDLDGASFSLGAGKSIRFAVSDRIEYEIFDNNLHYLLNNVIDYDKMNVDVFIRSRHPGDKIEQVGRGARKTLKKLFNELSLPDRDGLCIIADNEGVCFAEGAGVDERVKVTSASQKVLLFQISQQNAEDTGNDR